MATDELEDNPLAPILELFNESGDSGPSDGTSMTLIEHLEELRQRIFKSLIAIVLGSIVAFVFREQIMHWLTYPLPVTANQLTHGKLTVTGIGEGFTVFLKLSVAGGFMLALPVLLYQVWAFIAPGLYPHEKKHAVPFIVAGLVLFCLGLSVGFIVLQFPVQWLVNFAASDFAEFITVGSYFGFVALFLLAFGITFEIPLVLTFLSIIGVVDAAMLTRKRAVAHVGMWIAATVITPGADLYSPIFLGVSMSFLFELSIIFIKIVAKMRARADAANV
jgi:sec-independent protein translocase protein TatC